MLRGKTSGNDFIVKLEIRREEASDRGEEECVSGSGLIPILNSLLCVCSSAVDDLASVRVKAVAGGGVY